jgi:hypothetical protein
MAIPVILVEDIPESALARQLRTSANINLHEVIETSKCCQLLKPRRGVPEMLVVINADSASSETAVTTGLSLRNAGYQVFISTHADWKDLLEIMSDVYNHIQGLEKESPYQTELLVTDHAMELLGDVPSIVDRFEKGA